MAAAAMIVAALALHGAARVLLAAPCWGVAILLVPLAWPLWFAGREYAIFHRRVLLEGSILDGARVRRWLWRGHVSSAVQAVVSLGWAFVALGLAALLDPWQWLVLALDVVLLAALLGPVRRLVAREARPEVVDVVSRRWPLTLLNVAALSVAFTLLQFFVTGGPDTRGMTWTAVFDEAWSGVASRAACPATGAWVGLLAALERLSWHAAEVLVPRLADRGVRLGAWIAFLLQAGVLSYAFTRLLLGAAAISQALRRPSDRDHGPFSRTFWVTVSLVGALGALAGLRAQAIDWAQMQGEARRAVARANPCKPDAAAIGALSASIGAQLEAARVEATLQADAEIERRLDAIFGEAERGADRYLDWYFSVLGEYERLGALAAGDLAEMMARGLETHLFGDGMLGERLERASVEIARQGEQRLGAVARRAGIDLRDAVARDPCGLGALDLAPTIPIERDVARAMVAAGGGAMAGAVAVRSLGKRVASTTAARAASRGVFRNAANLLGRTVTKRGGALVMGGTAAALCSPGGPLALLCGIGVAAVTWLGMDQALVKIDEALFRDAMRAEIVASLAEQRREISQALRVQHHAAIDAMTQAVGAAVERSFVPARDG